MKLQHQIDRLLAHRASEWHQALENATPSQRAEFVAWLKQSPLHVQEYLETVYTDRVLAHADEERLEDIDALIAGASLSVVPIGTRTFAATASHKPQSSRWGRGAASLAAIVLLALCASWLPLRHLKTGSDYATALGEQRTIQLADASVVTLNADSHIEIDLQRTHRDIKLLRGEALFKVAHDPARPFTVRTKTALVQAVGTQFNVYERPSGTRVSVLEGRVKVRPAVDRSNDASPVAFTTSLGPGQEAEISPTGVIQRNKRADVMKTVAWRERRLIFDDTPLEDMVYEFNRYNPTTRLILEGVPPGTYHYNGIFNVTDPDSLAEILSKEPDLIIERRDREIIIRRR
jgi:transmembrane sensor